MNWMIFKSSILRSTLVFFLLFIAALATTTGVFAQEKETAKKEKKQKKDPADRKWAIRGYLKEMPGITHFDTTTTILLYPVDKQTYFSNLIHNRIQFKWYINDNFTFNTHLRNRFMHGSYISYINSQLPPLTIDGIDTYGELMREAGDGNGYLPLTFLWHNKAASVGISSIDRLNIDFVKGNFEARIGRQRINWGISSVWNPHDIFNTINFTDFDYEEGPGTDAVRIQYYTGVASSIEFAFSPSNRHFRHSVGGGLLRLNKGIYDFQILGAYFDRYALAGFGWAGGIKNMGFKGEWIYFQPLKNRSNLIRNVVGVLGFERTFKNTFLNLSFLYIDKPSPNAEIGLAGANINRLDPTSLSPYRWNMLFSSSFSLSPIWSVALTSWYSPSESHFSFVSPSTGLSVKENLMLEAFGQLLFSKGASYPYKYNSSAVFLRLKWSY